MTAHTHYSAGNDLKLPNILRSSIVPRNSKVSDGNLAAVTGSVPGGLQEWRESPCFFFFFYLFIQETVYKKLYGIGVPKGGTNFTRIFEYHGGPGSLTPELLK